MSIRDPDCLALGLVIASSACTSVQSQPGFDEVRGLVGERTGHQVHWRQGSEEDREVEARVDALLAEELTADSAVQVALLESRELQAVYESLGVAQADLVAAGLLRNPLFTGVVRFPEGGGSVGLDLAIEQDFLSVFYLPLRKRVAEAAFEAAKIRVAGAVLDLSGIVRAAFYEMQGAQQQVELRRSAALATQAAAELALRLKEAGNLRELDLATEQAFHEQARIDLAAAELTTIEFRERLNALLGLWGERTNWRVAPRLPEPPDDELVVDDLEKRAIGRSLELAEARAEIEREARALGFKRADAAFEELGLGVAAERELDGTWSLGPSASIPIPIFDQGQAAVARAQSRLRELEQRYAAEAVQVRAEVRAAASRLVALQQRARHYFAVVIPLRHRAVEETQKQYNAMQIGAFELLAAKREEIEAGVRYIETQREWWHARVELDQLLAGRRPRFAEPMLQHAHGVREENRLGEEGSEP